MMQVTWDLQDLCRGRNGIYKDSPAFIILHVIVGLCTTFANHLRGSDYQVE